MSVVFIDGKMLIDFVNNKNVFDESVDEHFKMFDYDGKGNLSRDKLEKRFGKNSFSEYDLQSRDEIKKVYNAAFDKFDFDRNGVIDGKEFKELMKEIMLAKAHGIGNFHVPIIVQDDSLIMRAVKHGNH